MHRASWGLLLLPWTGGFALALACLDNFDVHQDKIIRTQDSRAMGAKYLNEQDVASREECLRLCCQTQDCDVFVFEEKMLGSCYLFQCGTPEDFKCKFTKHHNYTSGVLVVNRRMTELESQIKHTQHEHELAKLSRNNRDPVDMSVSHRGVVSEVVSVAAAEPPTTAAGSRETAQLVPPTTAHANPLTEQPNSRQRGCSRFQFECHGSGECIAIYNACDGIPQCADASDEAPELGCPSLAQAVASTAAPVPQVAPASGSEHRESPGLLQPPAPPAANNQWPQSTFESQHANVPSGFGQQGRPPAPPPQSPPQLVNQARQYGREGEALAYHQAQAESAQWAPQTYRTNINNQGGSQIFSHKGSGLVAQSDRYRHVHGNRVMGEGGMAGQFDPMQAEYNRFNNYYENIPYQKMPQQMAPNNWQIMHKPHDINSMAGVEESMNVNVAVPNMGQGNLPGQDYYYEENFRTRLQPQMIPQRLSQIAMLPGDAATSPKQLEANKEKVPHRGEVEAEIPREVPIETESKATVANALVKKTTAHHSHTSSSNSTEKPKEAHHHHSHSAHRKVDTLSAELSLTENSFDNDNDGQNVNPRGAILSLTMGLCVTGIMLVLVGCRMRMVRRRMRRGSKSPYAHDADFLVNGMYL